MGFRCPECGSAEGLQIQESLELPADNRSDETALQILECAVCHFRALGVYEESRRGSLEQESWNHTGYRVPGPAIEELRILLQACPDPVNPACTCPVHRELGRQSPTGNWEGLGDLDLAQAFPL